MIIYNTTEGIIIADNGIYYDYNGAVFGDLLLEQHIYQKISQEIPHLKENINFKVDNNYTLLAPIGSQEVWAAGVTYFKSRTARMEESASSGGSDFYDRVYDAPRPELFFKSNAYRVRGHGQKVRVRKDSKWNVPEPEFTLVIHPNKTIIGYTIGNDMSSRSIEGENPLYLPQAKSYKGSTALGPGIYLTDKPLPKETKISIDIERKGKSVFTGETTRASLKRSFEELIDYLFMEIDFAQGCFLMTGTGIVPPTGFSLQADDKISIQVDSIGTLINTVD